MKFALIGDIHGYWNKKDIEYFNASDYDCLFFTGDLRGNPKLGKISFEGLTKRAYMIPGNWDGMSLTSIIGEVIQSKVLIHSGQIGQHWRMRKLSELVKPISLLGYSSLVLSKDLDLSLIVGRPHAMGGGLSFAPYMEKNYMVSNMDTSIEKYKRLIDGTKEKNLFFLSHNGPLGLGATKNSIYGAEFKKEGGDWGDLDLTEAIQYAKSIGKKVPLVLSGHMHHSISKKKERETHEYTGGTFYVNGAKVPRIREGKHFHTKIEWDGGSATVIPLWV
ncbi:metallophosphoesterase [Leptospira sp. 2 VSF19]|uniref:Metallophosphoesterase n=1 Tax=Leptospira soteropolitanensis TaxID=2950025 RepID=A0AAW5V7K9_9LEPT|nr:metallophosphoesterase [Leptospira soteropolitanensis]MCW7491287.1 metallophosphoesterase [Leptospira soteropolitanensis]MCW7498872.1 metallophosphoesterase [Leptospira soteropolitanensis]MCW7521536.1 metallophosphoesterase [Leptospira soteropolitanensis]MCW7524975.1 metallophosphoesterase [Leptospira soteropolitanensis]MCW7528843.1 metallophosphoesterase [Leptospira soteropolitanensis]